MIRSGIAGLFDGIGSLLFAAAYLASVYLSWVEHGLAWAIAAAIPVVGQLFWLAVQWSVVGPANWYSYLLGGALLAFMVSRLFGEKRQRRKDRER